MNDEFVTVVSPEFFDWLVRECERPAKADPRLVELFRAYRGRIVHR